MNSWHFRPAWVQLGIRQDLVGLEVGVDKGKNSQYMLQNLNIKKLYLIDPYFEQEKEFNEEKERTYIEGTKPREAYEIAKRILSPFEDKIEWLLGTTEEMIGNIKEPLDFVYIDGCHEYEFVKKDIELCLVKVKSGGVIGGHDLVDAHQGVVKAVLEKFGRDKLFVMNRDWWAIV